MVKVKKKKGRKKEEHIRLDVMGIIPKEPRKICPRCGHKNILKQYACFFCGRNLLGTGRKPKGGYKVFG